jgi:predicted alpha/beta-fold hydrolase
MSGLCFFSRLAALILIALLAATPGCFFSEHSFPIDLDSVVRVETAPNMSARQWLASAHEQLKYLLPHHRSPSMITSELVDGSGRPVDLVAKYGIKTDKLESLFVNPVGLSYSAQVVGKEAGLTVAPQWPGFVDVWAPIDSEVKLAGRLGMARDADGKIISADAIVLLPGLCGSNNVIRQRDLAAAFKAGGFHVLAVETRGLGQTAVRYPGVACTWGIFESSDLLLVSDWLEDMPQVKRTGLVGFSWGGAQATLAVWNDSRTAQHPSVSDKLARLLPKLPPRQRYRAGVMVFSPVLDMEYLIDKLATPQSYFCHPVRAGLQKTVRNWKTRSGFPNPTGQLHDVIRCKRLEYEGCRADQNRYVRLMPYKEKPSGDKFADIRVPLLMVHAVNDPVTPVQFLANLNAGLKNPNVATLILPTGGHIGFAPYAKDWFYSIMLNFFDPVTGPKPVETSPRVEHTRS